MVQIVGNLEWELLKNVEIRKSIYAHITNTRFVDRVCYIACIRMQLLLCQWYDEILIYLFHKMLLSFNQCNQSIIVVLNSLLIVL
jgi:hypothetical protein